MSLFLEFILEDFEIHICFIFWRTLDCDFLLSSNTVFSRKPSEPKFRSLLSQPFNCNTQSEVCSLWGRKWLGAPPIPQNRRCALSPPAPPLPLPRRRSPLRAAPAAAPRQASPTRDRDGVRSSPRHPAPLSARRAPSRMSRWRAGGEAGALRWQPRARAGRWSWDPRTEHGRWEKTPLFPPSAPPGPVAAPSPGGFQPLLQRLLQTGSGKEIEPRLAIKRETNGAFSLLSV